MAMVADLTSEQNRTKAMAAIGASIGLSFSVAMIVGPLLAAASGLDGVFFSSVVLSFVGILIVLFLVPTPDKAGAHRDVATTPELVSKALKNPQLLRLNWGIFSLHCILMASFVSVPSLLQETLALPREAHWMFYLPVLFLAFVAMLPLMIYAEKKRQVKPVFIFAVWVVSVSCGMLAWNTQQAVWVGGSIFVFFVAFNLLESMLPSLVSKIAPAGTKGTAMGVYSTSQFLGAFVGGAGGGWLLAHYSMASVFVFSASIAAVWGIVACFMQPPRHLSRVCLRCDTSDDVPKIQSIDGVEEAFFSQEEGLLYLKVDRAKLDEERLQEFA